MAETTAPATETSPTAPAATSPAPAAPEATTPPKAPAEATPNADETVTIKKSDYQKMIAGRDKANTDAAASGDFVLQLAKEREIDSYLGTNKDKFSFVTRDDLMHLDDPAELEAEATRLQKRFQDVVQDALMNVGQSKPPELSPEDKAKALKDIKKNKPRDGFQKMLALQEQPQQ